MREKKESESARAKCMREKNEKEGATGSSGPDTSFEMQPTEGGGSVSTAASSAGSTVSPTGPEAQHVRNLQPSSP
jgi:hypothetical protein